MENQNQHYGTHESMYVEDPNEQKQFLHSEEEEKPVVTGDPSETAEDHDLNRDTQAAGMADTDDLLDEVDGNREEPDPDDPDGDEDEDDLDIDPDSDDPGLDDDDPDDTDPDDLDTDDEDPAQGEDEDNVTYLK